MKYLLLILSLLALTLDAQENKKKSDPTVRGMTISCPGSGRSWGSDAMVQTMADLKKMGVNWITIHPYAGIRNNGRVASRLASAEKAPTWISRPIEEAHKLGLKVMIKPHLAYWGSKFSWRGEIEFQDKAERKLFFDTYRAWIVSMAKMSSKADAFVIGTELDRLVDKKSEWTPIVRDVRKVFKGPLTYAANWTDYHRVSFWSELDVVGIQAYFPVLSKAPADGALPKMGDMSKGWDSIMARMRAFSKSTGKKICFTELGYNRSKNAPYEPWKYETGGENAEVLQSMCMESALKAIEKEPTVVGSFLWKCFPGRRQPYNFNMHTAAMKKVIQAIWGLKTAKKTS